MGDCWISEFNLLFFVLFEVYEFFFFFHKAQNWDSN